MDDEQLKNFVSYFINRKQIVKSSVEFCQQILEYMHDKELTLNEFFSALLSILLFLQKEKYMTANDLREFLKIVIAHSYRLEGHNDN